VVRFAPRFPAAWPHASIRTPDFSLGFERDGLRDCYTVTLVRKCAMELTLPVRASAVPGVLANGQPAIWKTEAGFGQTILHLRMPPGHVAEVVVIRGDDLPVHAPVEVVSETGQRCRLAAGRGVFLRLADPQGALADSTIHGSTADVTLSDNAGHHLLIGEILSGSLPRHLLFKLNIKDPAASALKAESAVEIPVDGNWRTLDLDGCFNADVRGIYQQEYLSPRPATCSLRIGTDGYSPWTFYHWRFKPTAIDLTYVPAQLNERRELIAHGVPFSWGGRDANIAFTSLWDNWPEQVTVPVGERADAIWLLVCGSSNPMQCGIANGTFEFRYEDGSMESLDLIPPVNYWSLCRLGNRDYTHPRDGFCLPDVLPCTVLLGNNCRAMLLPFRLKPDSRLDSVTLRALSQEVVIGLMGMTLMWNRRGD
jgi:hypothetical protein